MPGWLTAALGIVDKLLGLFRFFQAEKHDAEQQVIGAEHVAVEEAKKIEEARLEREKTDRYVAGRTDADLDRSLDKWVRD